MNHVLEVPIKRPREPLHSVLVHPNQEITMQKCAESFQVFGRFSYVKCIRPNIPDSLEFVANHYVHHRHFYMLQHQGEPHASTCVPGGEEA